MNGRTRLQDRVGRAPCVCLYTVEGSRRVRLFKNQKNDIFFFIIRVFTKTRNYKKNNKKSAVHSEADCVFPPAAAFVTPSRLVLRATSGEAVSTRFISDPTQSSCQLIKEQVPSAQQALGTGSKWGPSV